MFQIAFYKGEGNAFNGFIRFWDGGEYSHCELIFSDGMQASATFGDGYQVRMRPHVYNPEHWDYITLPNELEAPARAFYEATQGMSYDLWGQVRFFISPVTGYRDGFWCSEWCAAALGSKQGYRYSPNILFDALDMATDFRGL